MIKKLTTYYLVIFFLFNSLYSIFHHHDEKLTGLQLTSSDISNFNAFHDHNGNCLLDNFFTQGFCSEDNVENKVFLVFVNRLFWNNPDICISFDNNLSNKSPPFLV